MVDCVALQEALEKLNELLLLEQNKCKRLEQENEQIRQKQALLVRELEQEEESISNSLMRRIEQMDKVNKERVISSIDRVEEREVSKALQMKLDAVMKEKVDLEKQLEAEAEFVGNRLQRQVDILAKDKKSLSKEREKLTKKIDLLNIDAKKLRAEKVQIEHTLETEEENIVNRLQAQIQKLLQHNVLLEKKLHRIQGGGFAQTSDSEQSESEYSSASARAAYLSSSPRSTRSGHRHEQRRGGDFISNWQRGAMQAQQEKKDSSSNNNNNNNNINSNNDNRRTASNSSKKDLNITSSQSGSQRESLDIPSELGRKRSSQHRTLSTGGPESDFDNGTTNVSTKGNDTPMSLPTTPRSGVSQQPSEIDF